MLMHSTFYLIHVYPVAMFWQIKVTTAIKFWSIFILMMPGPLSPQGRIDQSSDCAIGGYTRSVILWNAFFKNSKTFAELPPDTTNWLIPSWASFVLPQSVF